MPEAGRETDLRDAANGPVKPATGPLIDRWTTFYGLFLIGLIVGYYGIMVYFAGQLLSWSLILMRTAFQSTQVGWIVVAAVGILVLVFLLIRTIRHLIYASAGLVTDVNESVPEANEGIEIQRGEYPQLFELIDTVGDAVGSPRPDEVRVHHPPESFTLEMRRFGIQTKRRLILVLSVPQMGVFTTAELGVILAHELSHFGGGYTRLIVFLDRFANSLRTSTEAIGTRWWHWFDPIYWFNFGYLRAFVLLSAPLQRHQELLADRVSAEIFGGEVAARTLLKDWLLSNQFLSAIGSYEPNENGEAPENIFSWFRQRWRDFSTDGEDYLLRRLESQQQPSFWYDDPTIPERVQLMRKFPPQDIEPIRPVRELVANLDALEDRLHEEVVNE